MTSVVGIRSLPSLIRLSGESLPICMCRHLSLLRTTYPNGKTTHTDGLHRPATHRYYSRHQMTTAYHLRITYNLSVFISAVMSLMYSRNRSGPRTDPCGTPEHTSHSFDVSPLAATTEALFLSQSLIQSIHSG